MDFYQVCVVNIRVENKHLIDFFEQYNIKCGK